MTPMDVLRDLHRNMRPLGMLLFIVSCGALLFFVALLLGV